MARFSGDGPGLPRFDRCLTGLTRVIRSLALITLIRKLGRHITDLGEATFIYLGYSPW
jgi:hypothetical protein